MRLKFYILSILLTIAVPSFAQQYLGSSNLATVNETRKAAALVVQSTFSEYDLRFFDRVSYYDLNEERRSDVYIYVRESVDVREKDDLMESIYKAREKMHLYYDSVQDIRHSINALMDDRHPVLPNTDYSPSALGPEMDVETAEGQQNRGAFRELKRLKEKKSLLSEKANALLNLSHGYGDFVTIYTSASKNFEPIFEYRKELPEQYVMAYDIEQLFKKKKH